jgi:hypothetical protein
MNEFDVLGTRRALTTCIIAFVLAMQVSGKCQRQREVKLFAASTKIFFTESSPGMVEKVIGLE